MATVSFKCPNCGGDLRFDPKSQKYKCEYCFSDFGQAELDAANPQVQQAHETEKLQVDENGAVIYFCPSCGAQVVTDATTAATFCYYCHNPVVLQGNLSGEYEPDLVVPFTVDKKEAINAFLKTCNKKRFIPKDFFHKKQIEKISGVYFPFWVYECEAEGEWHGRGDDVTIYERGDTEYTETKVFSVDREGNLEFREVTRNALNKENKKLVEAIQPFKLEEAKDFNMGYLSGFLAEKRDIEKADLDDDIRNEIHTHAEAMLKNSAAGYTRVETTSTQIRIKDERWKYLLLPVWLLTYKGDDGKMYYYAMNGQTKKINGEYPVSMKRLGGLFAGIFIPLVIAMLMGGYFIW